MRGLRGGGREGVCGRHLPVHIQLGRVAALGHGVGVRGVVRVIQQVRVVERRPLPPCHGWWRVFTVRIQQALGGVTPAQALPLGDTLTHPLLRLHTPLLLLHVWLHTRYLVSSNVPPSHLNSTLVSRIIPVSTC